ncbi:phosphoribosylformylglycinamidine synthase I [Candidatus Peregrinibacteria bacterium]|jgi:phosphoribosylformylglycinamidine synthase subunit PurQ / glutaminase|nr:phosphoribosylformylglycinamidine synthase I [Candidatus Peregrinibacteria bacterium]
MKRIAIIQFPGLNSEYETKRAVDDAGMDGVIFRWNAISAKTSDNTELKLEEFDGYIVPGGFSYEDRGRAGLIPSLDPVMNVIRGEVAKGKPLLGICNGAQVVVETCMVPGSGNLELCLANNKRIKDGEIVGTGFINFDVDLKSTAAPGRCAFNINIEKDSLHRCPIAHGEGRFTAENLDTILELESNDQIVFKYCDKSGEIEDNYPTNPNGTFKNAAAICNRAGNVMAIMPHPERAFTAPIPEIFTSMKVYLEEYFDKGKVMIPEVTEAHASDYSLDSLKPFEHNIANFEIFVDLIITDNTAETFTNTLNLMGFPVEIKRQKHFTVFFEEGHEDPLQIAGELIRSSELLNTNKELATVKLNEKLYRYSPDSEEFTPQEKSTQVTRFYVKDREDFFGQNKTEKIQKHLKIDGFKFTVQGTVWTVLPNSEAFTEETLNTLLQTNIFANPNSQELLRYE